MPENGYRGGAHIERSAMARRVDAARYPASDYQAASGQRRRETARSVESACSRASAADHGELRQRQHVRISADQQRQRRVGKPTQSFGIRRRINRQNAPRIFAGEPRFHAS